MTRAIIAGAGSLPGAVFAADPSAIVVTLAGVPSEVPKGAQVLEARFEQLGKLFTDLNAAGVTEVVLAGAMTRPDLDPALFDGPTAGLAPALVAAMGRGDDALLRLVIAMIEDQGFPVIGAHEAAPGLAAPAGQIAGPDPDDALIADAHKAAAILNALGPLDVGQAAVVAGGLCLGIETVQGTNALLSFVADTRSGGPGGALVKLPKPGQELRVDMPTVGPDTIGQAARAGLKGIMVAAGQILIIDRAETVARADVHGLSLWAQDAG